MNGVCKIVTILNEINNYVISYSILLKFNSMNDAITFDVVIVIVKMRYFVII